MIGLGIGINYSRVLASIDTQAQAHYDRVIADGGIIPAGLLGCNAWFVAVKAVYGVTDITTAISAGYDPHYLGTKIGAGSGTTLGQAATKLYSCSGASGDLVQATAASQPLLLSFDGINKYLFVPKVISNTCTTPNSAAANLSGDFEIIVKADTFDKNLDGMFIGKADNAGQRSYYLYYTGGTGVINFVISTNGTNFFTASSTNYSLSNNTIFWVKVTRSGSTVTFYKSNDGITYSIINTASLSGTIFTGTDTLTIGNGIANGYPYAGKIYRATISNTIGGSPVVDFNPNSYNAATSQTNWTSTTGEVWTINTGTATTGYKGVLVDRSLIMLDGVDDSMNTTLSRQDILTQYLVYKTENASGSGYSIINSTNGFHNNSITPETTNMKLYMNAASSNLSKTLGSLLTFWTATNNQGVLNTLQKNNDTEVSNSYTPAVSGSGISIGKTGVTTTYQKGNVNTYIVTPQVDTHTQRTAMYNAIKSFNNNAF